MDDPPANWLYVPDETPKRKHGWDRSYAGFVEVSGVVIGKCPNTLGLAEAQELINNGLELRKPRDRASHPRRIYVVHEGVVYRATPTVPGVSYHGFPERPAEFRRLPRSARNQILDRAREQGQFETVVRWAKS